MTAVHSLRTRIPLDSQSAEQAKGFRIFSGGRGVPILRTATALAEAEEIMTDYQFRSILKMVLAIARKTKDADAIIRELENLLPADERNDAEKM
jgi:hypothetical protein